MATSMSAAMSSRHRADHTSEGSCPRLPLLEDDMLDARHRRWVIVLTSIGSVMAAIDTLVVSTAIPTIRDDLQRVAAGARVDRQRLQPQPRRAADPGRRDRRPARPGPVLRDRARAVRARLDRLRARDQRRRADRDACRAGRRRGAGAHPRAGAADRCLPAGASGRGGRPLQRRHRHRGRLRSARRRAGPERLRLAVDLLGQRADRPGRRTAGAEVRARGPGAGQHARRPGRAAARVGLLRARVGDGAQRRRGLGRARGARRRWPRAPCCSAASSAWERRAPHPLIPGALLARRGFTAGNIAAFLTLASLFAAVFFYGQLLQFGVRRQRARGRPAADGVDRDAHRRRAVRRRPGRPDRRAAAAERRPGAPGGRDALARGDRHGRRRLPRRARAVRGRRHRGLDGRPVRPERGHGRRRRPRRRHGSRRQRHDARARRRLRDRADRRGRSVRTAATGRRRSSSTGSSRRSRWPRRCRPWARWPGLAVPARRRPVAVPVVAVAS